jgi:hypothetical protein
VIGEKRGRSGEQGFSRIGVETNPPSEKAKTGQPGDGKPQALTWKGGWTAEEKEKGKAFLKNSGGMI